MVKQISLLEGYTLTWNTRIIYETILSSHSVDLLNSHIHLIIELVERVSHNALFWNTKAYLINDRI